MYKSDATGLSISYDILYSAAGITDFRLKARYLHPYYDARTCRNTAPLS
jgi:hypothetical protein